MDIATPGTVGNLIAGIIFLAIVYTLVHNNGQIVSGIKAFSKALVNAIKAGTS